MLDRHVFERYAGAAELQTDVIWQAYFIFCQISSEGSTDGSDSQIDCQYVSVSEERCVFQIQAKANIWLEILIPPAFVTNLAITNICYHACTVGGNMKPERHRGTIGLPYAVVKILKLMTLQLYGCLRRQAYSLRDWSSLLQRIR